MIIRYIGLGFVKLMDTNQHPFLSNFSVWKNETQLGWFEVTNFVQSLLYLATSPARRDHEVARPLQGGQGQVGVPQAPLLGHGVAVDAWN